MTDWKYKLNEMGFVHLPSQSEIELNQILEQLGNVINETDVIANADSKNHSDTYI